MAPAATMRVTISGVYSEYEVPATDERWNGWAVPGFTVSQVRQLAAETAALAATVPADEIDTITIGDDGTVSVHSGQWNSTTVVEPAPDGRYYIGAYEWAWEIIAPDQPPLGPACAGHRARDTAITSHPFPALEPPMTAPSAALPRVGVHIAEDRDYYASPVGDPEIVAEERRHFADGTWTAYLLSTVVECPHCGRRYTTDALGGVVVDTTSLVDSIVWADDPTLADTDDYLHEQIRDLIHTEQANPAPPTEWVPLPTD